MGDPHGVGIVGLGVISTQYLETLGDHPRVRIAATADLDRSRAEAVAARFPHARALTVDELVHDPTVDTVLNLTTPAAHAGVTFSALAAGRGVFSEKPLAADLDDARRMVEGASGAWLGCAPDTVLGTGVQTARAAVDGGLIGRPVSAVATWVSPGHEAWHPNPDFYYRAGGGPLFDMGPYYLTTLFQLLGPVVRVAGASSRARDTRVIGAGPRAGESIDVAIDTHVSGILEHVGGVLSTVTFSFDAAATDAAPLEVHGETGTLSVPDPNLFDGEVRLRRPGQAEWTPVTDRAGYEGAGRGIGILDRVATGSDRVDGEIALHVLEIMTAMTESARTGQRITVTTCPRRPDPVPFTSEASWRHR